MNQKEIAYFVSRAKGIGQFDSHSSPFPYRWFIITSEMTTLESFHKAERTGAGTSLVSSLMRYLQLGVANLLFVHIADSHIS